MMRSKNRIIQKAAVRAFIYNIVLEVVLWALILFIISQHHWAAVLSYELLLNIVILLMLGIYGITLVVFIIGILMGLLGKKAGNNEEK